ncbi:MAG TPA: hypothetical protein VGV18_04630 [Verrucomicrobiae bacterium]|nr:hypothetical protein [Verrucomicrobiae bacterium]
MKIVLLRLGKVFVIFALVATLSAHWALLQTVAWTSMLAGNLKSCSFHEAVTRTFDGQHPCPLCKAIAAARKSGQKNQVTFEQQKLDFPPVEGSLVLVAPSRMEIPLFNTFASSVPQKPPTPPPREFFV